MLRAIKNPRTGTTNKKRLSLDKDPKIKPTANLL